MNSCTLLNSKRPYYRRVTSYLQINNSLCKALRKKTLLVALFTLACEANATNKEDKPVYLFEIPVQSLGLSLGTLSEITERNFLFPYDLVENEKGNPVQGRFTAQQALDVLLNGTGLEGQLSDKRVFLIKPLSETPVDNDSEGDTMKTKKSLLATMLALIFSAPSSAQENEVSADADIEVINVRGIRASMVRAMDAKREAGGVVDSISAEDIGKFPDTNLAESLQRISGVSIDRSGGEGQLITVRGFGPQFNTVLVNGRQIASENRSRAFSFDTIASELVSSLDVHKTSSATTQSGGIGSTINVNTARPFSIGGFKVAGSIKGIYDDNSEETSPEISALISNSFDDEFGILLAVSHQQRDTRLDQAIISGWLENVGIPNPRTESGQAYSGNIFSPRNYNHQVTFEERTRTNANLVLQYAPSDSLEITADILYSDFDVETDATAYGHWFTAPNVRGFDGADGPTVDGNGTVTDLYQEVGLATDFSQSKFDRLTNTSAIGLNFDWDVNDNLNMTFDISHSNAEREPNNGRGNQLSVIGYANRVRFQLDDNILPVMSEFDAANANIFSGQQEIDGVAYQPGVTPEGVSNYLDTANSRAHVMLRRGWAVEDDVDQLRWDSVWTEDSGSGLSHIRFGAMYSSETKALTRWDNEGVGIHCTFCGYPNSPDVTGFPQFVFDAGSDFLGDVSGSGRVPTQWLGHDAEAYFAFLEGIAAQNGNPISYDAVRRNNSFEVSEDTLSVYMEMDFEAELAGMPFYATAGARYESTDVEIDGTNANISDLRILDETEMLASFNGAESIRRTTDYEAILPNISAKLEISDDLISRFAASQTITRPTLDSLSPVTVIGTTRQGGDLTSTSGNPELIPFKSDNLDLSLEWYYADASYMSAGYFRKNVANFIINSTEDKIFELADGSELTDPSTGNDTSAPDSADGVAVFTNTLPSNGGEAIVDGWEIALQHSFGESGFGVMTNATLVDTDSELDPADITQVFAVTGLSDSLNVVAFYEKGPFQARIAWNWRDSFVQSLTQLNGDGVVIVEDYQQFDVSGSYDLNDNLSVFFEGINLTEEFVHKRGRFANQLLEIEDSGRRFAFGIRGSF